MLALLHYVNKKKNDAKILVIDILETQKCYLPMYTLNTERLLKV